MFETVDFCFFKNNDGLNIEYYSVNKWYFWSLSALWHGIIQKWHLENKEYLRWSKLNFYGTRLKKLTVSLAVQFITNLTYYNSDVCLTISRWFANWIWISNYRTVMKDFFTHHISRFPLFFCSFGLKYFIMHILFSVYFLKNLVEIRWKEQSITNCRLRYVMLFFWTTYFTLLCISGECSLVLFIPYLLQLLLTSIKFTYLGFYLHLLKCQ